MKKELEEKLFKKYPSLFAEKDLPMEQTCMCWGIECGDGWYNIISTLCELLTSEDKYPDLRFTQVKEKYGTLRIYTNFSDDTIDILIGFAGDMSGCTCETCGSPGEMKHSCGWFSVKCNKCFDKIK